MAETGTRTVAFLFCDTVGSTELLTRLGVEASEELRRRLWAVLREAVAATLGEEVKSLGDGLMIAFPVSSGDAVACAIAMQRGVVRLNLERRISALSVRIGLSVGEATLAPEERDWFGPAVNLAARLCAHAAPGQIVASATLADVVALPPDEWEQLGPLTLKGFDAAVPAVAIRWLADGLEGRVPLPSALDVREGVEFVGRVRELGELAAAWRRAVGGSPSTVLLVGEPGMGKSRLARELAGRCHAGGGTALHGRGEAGTSASWATPLAEALRWYVASVAPESLARDLGSDAVVLSTIVPSLRWRLPDLGRTLADPAPRLHDALVHALCSVAARNPTLLVLDDVEAVDDQVLAVVDAAQHLGARLLVVGVCRDGGGRFRWERATRLVVDGLNRGEVVTLVDQIAPGAVPPSDVTVKEVTGGIPRHVIDAARQLAESRTDDGPLNEAARRLLAARSCPYRGLAAFGEEDHTLWFGRDDLLATVLGRLDRARLVALVGASGSGKSSLLHAGVVASLRRGALAGSERWPVATMVPGDDPVVALAAALGALPGVLDDPTAIAHELRADANALARLAARLVDDESRRLIVVVDQFEELFRSGEPAARDAFVERLLAAASTPGGAVTVVIAVRADFYGALTDVPGLGAAVEANHSLVAAMSESELAVAVTRPAFVAGLRLEDGLAETVVSDVTGQAGGLPLLSHALLETWRRRQGRTLTLAGYRAAGGVRGAIGRTADDVFVGLDDDAQRAMRDLFLRLVMLGEGAEDTRRRVTRRELPPAQAALVEPLVAARLLTADHDRVEVAHEALIREWPRLRRWLDEERDTLRTHRHLTTAAAAWEASHHDGAELYGGARLQAALDWADTAPRSLNDVETEFLAASHRRRRDAERRRRRFTIGLATLAAVAMLAAVGAVVSQRRATVNARRADNQRREADLRRLVADAGVSETQNLQRALLLAREANLRESSPRTIGALQTALTANPAILGYLVDDGVGVYSVDATADGRTLVAGRVDGTVEVWDVEARHLVERLPSFGGKPVAVAVDPDGTMLVIARSDATYASWDLRTHRLMADAIGGLAPSSTPIGRLLRPPFVSRVGFLIAAADTVLAVPSDGSAAHIVYHATGTVLSTTATDNGQTIAVAVQRTGQSYGIDVVARDGFRQQTAFAIGVGSALSELALDPSASHVAFTMIGASSYAQIFDIATGQPSSAKLVDQEDPLPVYRADGSELLLPSSSGDLSHRDPVTGQVRAAPDRMFFSGLYDIRVSSNGARLYAGGADGAIALISLTADSVLARAIPGAIGNAAVSADGTRIAVVAVDSTLSVFDATTGQRLGGPTPTGYPVDLQQNFGQFPFFSPDGGTIELGSDDNHIVLADGHTGIVRGGIAVPSTHTVQSTMKPAGLWNDVVFPAGWSPDGRSLAIARWDSVVVLDAATGAVRYEVRGLVDHVTNMNFTSDGAFGAAADYNGGTLTFDATNGAVLSTRHGRWVNFLPGTHTELLTDYFTRITELVDVQTGVRAQPAISSVGLELPSTATADGRTLFFGSNTGRIRMYDRTTQLPVGDGFPQPGQLALPFLFDHDRRLVSGLGQVLVWDVDMAHWGDVACRAAGRNLSHEEWRLYLPPGEPYRATCPQFPPGA